MKRIRRSALVPHSARQMYALVDDIPEYPRFLPWCCDANVITRNDSEAIASLEIEKSGFRKKFTTRNELEPGRDIRMRLEEGPFRVFEGHWTFSPLDDRSCKVEFDLQFEFSSPILGMMLNSTFEEIGNTLVDAFTQRAESVYGQP